MRSNTNRPNGEPTKPNTPPKKSLLATTRPNNSFSVNAWYWPSLDKLPSVLIPATIKIYLPLPFSTPGLTCISLSLWVTIGNSLGAWTLSVKVGSDGILSFNGAW